MLPSQLVRVKHSEKAADNHRHVCAHSSDSPVCSGWKTARVPCRLCLMLSKCAGYALEE